MNRGPGEYTHVSTLSCHLSPSLSPPPPPTSVLLLLVGVPFSSFAHAHQQTPATGDFLYCFISIISPPVSSFLASRVLGPAKTPASERLIRRDRAPRS